MDNELSTINQILEFLKQEPFASFPDKDKQRVFKYVAERLNIELGCGKVNTLPTFVSAQPPKAG